MLDPRHLRDTELSDNFTWAEAETTSHREFDNTIPTNLLIVVKNTAKQMERARAILQCYISVNSWYRSPEVNKAVGGAKNSQHMLGEAVDFICPKFGKPVDVVKKLIQYPELFRFDQLILEHTWVHASFPSAPTSKPRMQVLSLLHNGGYSVGITDKFGVPL